MRSNESNKRAAIFERFTYFSAYVISVIQSMQFPERASERERERERKREWDSAKDGINSASAVFSSEPPQRDTIDHTYADVNLIIPFPLPPSSPSVAPSRDSTACRGEK
jgi:hypothetical protein